MTEYLTEQEQIELLKNWIKQYGMMIMLGTLLALLGATGWHYWQQRRANILSHASSVYDEMLTKRIQNHLEATAIQAKKIGDHYSQTIYGQMADFMLAREAIMNQNYSAAQQHLQRLIDRSGVASFRQIARIRLARILLAQQKPADAIKVLQKEEDNNFNGFIDEVRGDAYLKMRNPAMARECYKKALTELPNAEVIRPLLQMKYDNLATT